MSDWPVRTISTRRDRLPHWTVEGGTYFITFRLADALSPSAIWHIRQQQRAEEATQDALDRAYGSCAMREERIAAVVDGAIRHFDDERYRLHAWTIMPNHVHVAVRLMPGVRLDAVTHAWKSFTANEANKLLKRRGPFWQDESYDTLLHDQHDLDRVIDYIVRNPVKAGLANWRWTTVLRTEFVR